LLCRKKAKRNAENDVGSANKTIKNLLERLNLRYDLLSKIAFYFWSAKRATK
jgi:hypothetical protein